MPAASQRSSHDGGRVPGLRPDRGTPTLPGGLIAEVGGWLVEDCIGPLGIGTLVVKPRRHVLRFAELTAEEAAAFGPVMRRVTSAVTAETGCDQTYVTQWAHAGWTPGHIHFVVQPAWDSQRERFERPGPFMQVAMFEANEAMDEAEIEAFCQRVRARLGLR